MLFRVDTDVDSYGMHGDDVLDGVKERHSWSTH